ncbi:MAG: TonB-dependent receptor plug domain-containing protein [Bacteroidota bacterium]
MRYRSFIVLIILGLGSSLSAQGIRDSLFRIEGVEITAPRIFIREQAGIKQTRVDSSVMQSKMSASVSDLLSENTSVFIKNHGRGALATASFRGTAASHTLVNWNGISINSPMAGMVDFSMIPVYIIDDLHLKHGAASVADRSGGIGGSIHMDNSVDWNEEEVFSFVQGIGSYQTRDEFVQLGMGNKKIRSKTRLYHNYSKNNYSFTNRGIGHIDPLTGDVYNPLDTNDNAAYTRYGLLQELYLRPGSDHLISLKYWGQYADRTIPRPTSYEGPDNSNLNNQQDEDHRIVADWKYYSAFGRLMLRSGYSDKQLDYSQRNRVPGLGLVPAVYSESRQRSLFNTLSYTKELAHDFSIEGVLDVNAHQVSSRDSVSALGYDSRRNEVSVFAAIRKGFVDRINLNLMLRQEWVDGERAPFIPFLGMDLRLLKDVDLILKGSIARNYHYPSLNDLYWQPGGNPRLLPEEGFSLETGLEYQQVFSGHLLKAEITAYRTDINNWIVWIPSYRGYWEPRNIQRVLSGGLESSIHLSGRLQSLNYRFSGTYGYTSAKNFGDPDIWSDASYGKQLVYVPLHSGNVLVNLSLGGFFINYQYNAYSERFTTSSNDVTKRDRLYPYFMNDVSVGKNFRIKQLSFSVEFKVYNLFNESYHSILYRPMPGRNYYLTLVFKI